MRKCCACHEICTRPCESAAPATKSILDLAKVLRLPRNSNLAKPSRGRANGPVSEPVPGPFQDRSETASVQASRPRWFAHCPEAQFTHSASVSASCYLPARREWTQHLAKVLRLPRNLYLTLRKCCACHATQTLQNLRAAVPMGPSPNPFRTRSGTVPRPFRDRASRPRWFARRPEAQFTHSASVFCILPSPSSHKVDAAPCESAAPATKSILDLAKVLRLPRNLYLTLRKCCACHAIQTLRNLRAAVPMVPSPRPFRDRSETVPRPFRDRSETASVQALRTVRKPNSRMAPTFLQLAIPQLAESGRSTLRKCCACHEICTRPRESAAPATKSILDLAKVLHLPRNSNLAKPSRGRANGPVSETVPRPFRDRSETVPGPFRDRLRTGVATEVVCALSGSPIHAWHQRFCNLLSPSSQKVDAAPCESAAPATKSVLDLAKVLRLPRNLYLTLRKCCTCHAIQPSETFARPCQWSRLRDRSETVPRPFRDRSETASVQASRPRWFAHCPEAQFTHGTNVSATCYPSALLISAFLVAFFAHIHVS